MTNISRRSLFAGAGILALGGAPIGALAGSRYTSIARPAPASTPAPAPAPAPGLAAPPQAAAQGFNTLSFYDPMTSLSTFDLDATGAPGFNWYLDQPFGYPELTASDVALLPRGGVQILANQIDELGICTYSTKGATGFMFQHGYVQAVVSFNPALGTKAAGWPAFWGLAVEHLNGTNDTEWSEFDYFEACTGGYSAYNGEFVATLHDWKDGTNYESVPGNDIAVSVNWNNQQTLGALWAPGVVQWYLNNTLLRTVTFSATGVPNDGAAPPNPPGTYWIMESQHLPLILGGGGAGWPLNVYSVAAWT